MPGVGDHRSGGAEFNAGGVANNQQQHVEALSKKSFRPTLQRRTSLGVEPSSQILDILEYACGLILGLVLISNENLNFERASI